MKESACNEEDEIFLKAFYEAYTILSVKPSCAQLFRMSGQLVEENDKLREYTLGLKESLRHLKDVNASFKIEIPKKNVSDVTPL